jgi:hypothetical protein
LTCSIVSNGTFVDSNFIRLLRRLGIASNRAFSTASGSRRLPKEKLARKFGWRPEVGTPIALSLLGKRRRG